MVKGPEYVSSLSPQSVGERSTKSVHSSNAPAPEGKSGGASSMAASNSKTVTAAGEDVVLAVRTDSALTTAASSRFVKNCFQRLKNLVEQKSGGAGAAGACRLWVGEHDRYGYGVLRATVAGKRIHFLAHRLAFFLNFLAEDDG
ncbi:hypothetical protein DPMN_192394 [Dreissena polymorpha]|uniref:Uncharacterized protein n=1 Tax=Dreissena polymorpha TaxID=45954 RepID=A0A9D3XZ69_DREPO|nr:hypothetical protein DPMN_192394 [Dreissena polymorpha]